MAEIVKGLFQGAASGSLDTLVGIPSLFTGGKLSEEARKATKLEGTRPNSKKDPWGALAYDFAEGGVPAGMFGLVGGPVTAAVTGAVGGLANVASKRLFADSPWGQAAVNVVPMLLDPSKGVRQFATRPTPATTGRTGVTLTPGQATGDVKQLAKETRLASTAEGAAEFGKTAKYNQTVLKNFANEIQDISQNTKKMSATTIRNRTIATFNKYSGKLLNKFRAENKANFSAAAAKVGDAEVFNAQPVVDKLNDLIALYGSEKMPAELQIIAKKLQGVVDNLTVKGTPASPGRFNSLTNTMEGATQEVPATVKSFNIRELQKNLESWGQAAYGDGSKAPSRALEGVAKGTVQSISREILGAYRTVLDDAADLKIPGAQELKNARTTFRDNLRSIEDVAVTPIFKKFGIDNPNAIKAEDAVKALANATPSERVILMQVLDNRHDLINALRGRAFETVMKKSGGDIAKMRQGVADLLANKTSQARDGISDLEFMFPTAKEQEKLLDMFDDMGKLARNSTGVTISGKRAYEAEKAMTEAGGVVGGAPARYSGNIFVRLYENFLQDPTKFIDAYNNPNYFKNLTNADPKFIASATTDSKVGKFFENIMGTTKGIVQESPVTSSVAFQGMATARDVNTEQRRNEPQEIAVPEDLLLDNINVPQELLDGGDINVPDDLMQYAPKSVRNNNPLNLTDSSGKIRSFDSLDAGTEAGMQDLNLKLSGASPVYRKKFGNLPVTPSRLAEVWSPSGATGNSQQSTTNYGGYIASQLGIDPNQPIPNTPEAQQALFSAMSQFESGIR